MNSTPYTRDPSLKKPCELSAGDVVEGYGHRYEIVVPDKRGMAKLRNLSTGKIEDYNACNNWFAVIQKGAA